MQIQKKKQIDKKVPLLVTAVIVILALGYIGVAYATDLWPFSTSTQSGSRDHSDDDTKKTIETDEDNKTSKEEPASPTDEDNPPTDNTPSYPDSPLLDEPDVGAPYPITNEHYQIKQDREKVFSITLYPIANNPEYTDYNAQLKAYKQEALSYLQSRYGTTADLTITWSPEDAAAL